MKIIENTQFNRINLQFDEKPSKEILQKLKDEGWRYSPQHKLWYPSASAVENSRAFAESLQKDINNEASAYMESMQDAIDTNEPGFNSADERLSALVQNATDYEISPENTKVMVDNIKQQVINENESILEARLIQMEKLLLDMKAELQTTRERISKLENNNSNNNEISNVFVTADIGNPVELALHNPKTGEYFSPIGGKTNLTNEDWKFINENPKLFENWRYLAAFKFATEGKPITELTGNEFQKVQDESIVTRVLDYYTDLYNNEVKRNEIGIVILDKEGIKDSLAHGMSRLKASAYAAVPKVIESGIIYNYENNWKNRNYDTCVVIAPVNIDGKVFAEEVVLKKRPNKTGFYLHEVELKEKLLEMFKTPTERSKSKSYSIIARHFDKVKNCNVILNENYEPSKEFVDKIRTEQIEHSASHQSEINNVVLSISEQDIRDAQIKLNNIVTETFLTLTDEEKENGTTLGNKTIRYEKWYKPMVDEIMADIANGNKDALTIVQNFDLDPETHVQGNKWYTAIEAFNRDIQYKLLPELYEKVQDRIKAEYEEKKIPYVVMFSSESPKFPSENKVYTVKEFNEILLQADSEFHNRKKYAEQKYGSADKYWDLERDDKLPEEDKGIQFGYDKTNFKFFNIPNPNNPEDTFSYEPSRYDIGDGNGSIFDYVRATCSHDKFIEALNALETQLYFPGVTDSQREFVEKTVEEETQVLKANLIEKMEELDKAQNEYKELHKKWLIEATEGERVDEMIKTALKGIKETYDSSMNDIFTKVLNEYPFSSGDVAESEFLKYTANEVKKMVISELYLPSRNAQKAMNAEDYKTYNSIDWEKLRRIWEKFPANVNMTAFAENLLQERCNEKGMSVPENTKALTPPTFINDYEKIKDFYRMTKEEFLNYYSFLTEEEYNATFDEIIHSDDFIEKFGDWEKAQRLEKLKNDVSLETDGKIILNGDDITETVVSLIENEDRKSIQSLEKEIGKSVIGKYVNNDTGLTFNVSNRNVTEISNHHYLWKEHIKSISLIPQISEKAIFIGEEENEDKKRNPNIVAYKYFATGIKIDDDDYTCKVVIGVDDSKNCYYDQSLSTIEKGKLIDILQEKNKLETESFELSKEEDNNLSPLITQREATSSYVYYDKRLIKICQVPQMPYLDEDLKPTLAAVQAVHDGLLYIEKKNQQYVMNSLEEKAENARKQYEAEQGSNYDSNLSTTDIAKKLRTYVKENYPEYKFSITSKYFSGGSEIKVILKDTPVELTNFETMKAYIEKYSDNFNRIWDEDLHTYTSYYGLDEEGKNRFVEKQLRVMPGHSISRHNLDEQLEWMTPEAKKVMKDVVLQLESYNFDHSDSQSDYYHVNFWSDYGIDSSAVEKSLHLNKEKSEQKHEEVHTDNEISLKEFIDSDMKFDEEDTILHNKVTGKYVWLYRETGGVVGKFEYDSSFNETSRDAISYAGMKLIVRGAILEKNMDDWTILKDKRYFKPYQETEMSEKEREEFKQSFTSDNNTVTKQTELTTEDIEICKKVIPPVQFKVTMELTKGEEGEFFTNKLKHIADTYRKINTDKELINEDGTHNVGFRYFMGDTEIYLSEIDSDGIGFGYNILNGDLQMSEWGSTSLEEIMKIPYMEMDYHVPEGMTIERMLYQEHPDYFAEYAEKEESVEQKRNADSYTNEILDKIRAAGMEVVTDKDEFDRILETEDILQKMTNDEIIKNMAKQIDDAIEEKNRINAKKLENFKAEVANSNEIESKIQIQNVNITDNEKEILSVALKETAEEFISVVYSWENYRSIFDKSTIESPIETIKLGSNQFVKLSPGNRNNFMYAIRQTLENPSIILGKETWDNNSETFKPVHLYGKSFVNYNNSEKLVESLIIFKEGNNIAVSLHPNGIDKFVEQIKTTNDIVYLDDEVSRVIGELSITKGDNVVKENENFLSRVRQVSYSSLGQESYPLININYNRDSLLSSKEFITSKGIKTGKLEITKDNFDRYFNILNQHDAFKDKRNKIASELFNFHVSSENKDEMKKWLEEQGYTITEKEVTQYMKNDNGLTYGFVHNGKIYLNSELMNSNAAVREYTHLWDAYTQKTNPELWNKGLNLFKDTKYWNEVISDPNYQDIKDDENLVLSEIHSRICGDIAQKVLERIAELDGEQVKLDAIDWNKEIYFYIREEFELDEKYKSLNFTAMNTTVFFTGFLSTPMKDLMASKNINVSKELSWEELASLFQEKDSSTLGDFKTTKETVQKEESFETEKEYKDEVVLRRLDDILDFHAYNNDGTDVADENGNPYSDKVLEEKYLILEQISAGIVDGKITSLDNAQILLNDQLLHSDLYHQVSVSKQKEEIQDIKIVDEKNDAVRYDDKVKELEEQGFSLKEYGLVEYNNFNGPQYSVFSNGQKEITLRYRMEKVDGERDSWKAGVIYDTSEMDIEPVEPLEVYTFSLFGYEGTIVQVETDLRPGIPAFDIVGLADSAVKETRERIQAAFRNSGLEFPAERVLQSLSPADLRKDAPMDLSMALGILGQTNKYPVTEPVLALGELELSGGIRPVRGAVASVNSAKTAGITNVVCDPTTAELLKNIDGIKILTAENLKEANEKLMDTEAWNKKFSIEVEQRRQREFVREKTRNTDLWMKTPTGDESLLREQLWLDIQTPNFKRNFGNWNYDENHKVNIISLDTTDLPFDYENIQSLKQWLKTNLVGKSVEIDSDGQNVKFNSRTTRASIKRRGEEQRGAYSVLDDLIENSVYFDFEKTDNQNKHNHLKGQDVYYSALKVGEKLYSVRIKIDVSKDNLEGAYKDHKVAEINIAPNLYHSQSNDLYADIGANVISMAVLTDFVKPQNLMTLNALGEPSLEEIQDKIKSKNVISDGFTDKEKELFTSIFDVESTPTVQFNDEWMEDFKEALENLPMDGHFETIRAIEIAVAGKHNILATGAPGCGKTLLTQTLMPALTPKLTEEEAKQITRINSLAGLDSPKRDNLIPPFRMPHQTATIEGICGGGPNCRPGEISLAHNGTLFMDETAEFRSSVIQLLRVPLESRQITLSRAGRSTTYPADFQLAMTMNPCPCGCYGSPDKICLDSARSIEQYWKKISDPLLDRVEIKTFVQKDVKDTRKISIEEMKAQIATAFEIQRKRGVYNSHMTPEDIQKYCKLDNESQAYLDKEEDKLTPIEKSNLLKLSLTIANMDGREEIHINDIKEARELSAPVFEKPRQFVYDPEEKRKATVPQLDDVSITPEQIKDAENERKRITEPVLNGEKTEMYTSFKNFEDKGVFEINGTHLNVSKNGGLTPTGWKQLQAAMEIYRSKKFETFRYIIINEKNGEIADQLAITSHMPNYCNVSKPNDETLKQVISRLEELGDDYKLAVCHNHPSGNTTESSFDRELTDSLDRSLRRSDGMNKFLGHIILDHDTFNLAVPSQNNPGKCHWKKMEPQIVNEVDRFTADPKPEWADNYVGGTSALKAIAIKINDTENWNDDFIPVVFTNADRNISGVQYYSKSFFENDSSQIRNEFQFSAMEAGAIGAFPVITDALWNKLGQEATNFEAVMKAHVLNDAFTDVAFNHTTMTEKYDIEAGRYYYSADRDQSDRKIDVVSTWTPSINTSLFPPEFEQKKEQEIER